MTAVTIIGPNLYDQSKGQFHVHAKGCSDIKRDPKRYGYASAAPHMEAEASSYADVAEYVYGDIIDERIGENKWLREHGQPDAQYGETAEEYVDEFHFAPCVKFEEAA